MPRNETVSKNEPVVVSVDLHMDPKHLKAILNAVPGETYTQGQKVAMAALGLLEQLAEGGIMLPRPTVKKMADSFGTVPEVTDVLEKFEAGCGRREGHLAVSVTIDPQYEKVLADAAEFNGFQSTGEYYKMLIDTAWDQGWFHSMTPMPRRVLMSEEDHAALAKLVGAFENGTELVGRVKEFVESNSLFASAEGQ